MASSVEGGPTPAKIILKQSTGMSLNDRFTLLNKTSPRLPQPNVGFGAPTSVGLVQQSSGTLQSRVQRAQSVRSAQQQAREHMLQSRRLPQSAVSPTSSMRSAQRPKETSLKSRLGVVPTSNVKQRLGLGPGVSSQRGAGAPSGSANRGGNLSGRQPLSVRPIPRFRPARPNGSSLRDRLGSAPANNRPRGGASSPRRQRSAAEPTSDRRTLRGRGPTGQRARLSGRSRGSASTSYGGFSSAQSSARPRQRQGQGQQRRRGGLTGRKSESDKQQGQALSKDELDLQLDAYMNKSKALGTQIDAYMAQASSGANAMQL